MKSRQSIVCLSSYSHITFFSYALVIFLATITISASYNEETDYQVLLSFKSMITHDPFGSLTSWNSSFHLCEWSGVSCGKRHRRVTVIQLESQGLEGSLSPHLGNLSFLHDLSLWNNSLEGTIPHELGHLSRLRYLNLGNNRLVGSIPMDLSFLSKLLLLVVEENNFTGGIPRFLGNMTSLEGFSAAGNPLGGIIPDTLGHLKNLRLFHCGGCNLYGTISESIFNLSLLVKLTLPDNQLTGSLPQAIGAMLRHLVTLQLRDNQLSGHIPPWISNCSKLLTLEMGTNNFWGELMIDFTKLVDISLIALFSNNIYGRGKDYEMNFIDSLKNCSRLQSLDLGECKFQGVVPNSIGNLSQELW
uniref:putative receptor-like protein kinase At3g47110 n=1 Tax=Erigeron canadensis TaxID=72917 RepID=UPI001CB97E65|nr:putative receptor-like protein kinase At3g47110 [Erigeron canadensis]